MVDRQQHKKTPNGQQQIDGSRVKGPQKLEDYWYYFLYSSHIRYENITEFIINHIKKIFEQGNDIA